MQKSLVQKCIYPQVSTASMEVANLTERKKYANPKYGVKEFPCMSVCLSVCLL